MGEQVLKLPQPSTLTPLCEQVLKLPLPISLYPNPQKGGQPNLTLTLTLPLSILTLIDPVPHVTSRPTAPPPRSLAIKVGRRPCHRRARRD